VRERKLNFGLPLVARKTVWVYRVFWTKIETKPQKKIHTRLKQSFFLFIYLFIIIIIMLLLLFRQSKKPKRKLIYLFYLFFIFLYFFLKKTNYYYLFYYLFSRTKLGVDTHYC